ncbi:MAG: ASKHA domain-containing protein [Desulfobulbaceae bacterium]|nr:ASKHA domain-containing protein [Desulfobulbaceae bacterium]
MGEKVHVTFEPVGRTVDGERGEILIDIARRAGIHINASCGGSGVCGKCRIRIEHGRVAGEKSEKISSSDFEQGVRLACSSTVTENVSVRIPLSSSMQKGGLSDGVIGRHRALEHHFDIEELRREGIFSPPVEKVALELPPTSLTDNMADAGRIVQGLKNQYDEHGLIISLAVLRKIRKALREKDFHVTVTLARPVHPSGKTHVVNIQSGNWVNRNFGLAVDIGTTTVWGQLIDLHTGKILANAGDYNGQISYGEDVISRIIYAEKPKGAELMQELVVSTINKIVARLLVEAEIDRDEIGSITIAANTTMTHLFLSLEPHNIRRAPYVPVSTFFPPIRATDLGLQLTSHAIALLYPAISSYVGGDIVAGVMGSGMYRTNKLTLYIDIGTNAEIVIGSREWLVCAACSAGPAFEGGGITFGMRAADGAITDFGIDPGTFEPMNITIGRKPPVGICGSGLLIIVAVLFEKGIIDQRGRFRRDLATQRIREGRSGFEYVLVWQDEAGIDSDIVINEVDIGNFIRAKAAIYAGVKTLIEEVGLSVTDLEQIILAGAFGSYIDLDSAMTVGLLPEFDPGRVLYVGNGSLMGARMSELSNHIRQDVVEVVQRMTSFELSEVANFKEQYVASLFLPHTDISLFPKIGMRLHNGASVGKG